MCGIVASVGQKAVMPFLIDGLKNLEYRGYDSAGLTVIDGQQVSTTKAVGQVINLVNKIGNQPSPGKLGVGHTRWATHGEVLLKNTHPHSDADQQFFVVHNGIIENYDTLKEFLIDKGYTFSSDTDTEIIPQLLAYNFKQSQDVRQAIFTTLQALKGAYAVAIIAAEEPQKLWGAKLSGPLVLGIAKNQFYLASDATVLSSYADKIVVLEDYEVVEIDGDNYTVTNLQDESVVEKSPELLNLINQEVKLQGFPDFMSQEIAAIPQTVENVIRGRLNLQHNIVKLGGLDLVHNQLQYINRIIIIACGSSYFAGLLGEYIFEEIAGLPVEVQLASEFRYRKQPLSRDTAMIVISQSGETADTIAALQKVSDSGILKLGVVNVVGSTINRLTDAGVHCRAGVEKSVAATKSFIAQVTVLILMALYLDQRYPDYQNLLQDLVALPEQLRQILDNEHHIQKIAKKYSNYPNFLFLGRRYGYPVALEGALKLKEISYIPTEGLAAGEIKHGTLALVNKDCPTLAIALTNDIYDKMSNNLAEVKARQGKIITITDQTNKAIRDLSNDLIIVPKTHEILQPLLATLACHIFAYHVAKDLDRPIDRPRNLAKSVTVE